MNVLDENDLIVLFPHDRMVKGVGDEIDIEIKVSEFTPKEVASSFARLLSTYTHEIFRETATALLHPKARIQVRISSFREI